MTVPPSPRDIVETTDVRRR